MSARPLGPCAHCGAPNSPWACFPWGAATVCDACCSERGGHRNMPPTVPAKVYRFEGKNVVVEDAR